ncbi:MAG: addiction module protein [Gemmatimonadetes bacterium]|nr:addiction module protein [Gemmatimonadota bacterium]
MTWRVALTTANGKSLGLRAGSVYPALDRRCDIASKLDELEAEALNLSAAERARLVSRLVARLDEYVDEDVELAWVDEAERRYQEVLRDPAAAESAAVAFQRARDALR